MYAGTVAVPLILGAALHLTQAQVVALISADLFTSGLATLLQTLGLWKFGAHLPLVQGCSLGRCSSAGRGFALLPSLVMCVSVLIVMTETTGNCLAIGEITRRKIGPNTLTAAFRADGLATMLGGVFNSFPYSVYSQNTGLLSLSKMKNRYAVAAGGGILVALGFLPKLAAVISGIPRPMLGGASIVMFGMTAMAGIEELARVRYSGTNNAVVVAVSVALGMLPIAAPQLFGHAPEAARLFLNSGIFLTAASAVVLNLFFQAKQERDGL